MKYNLNVFNKSRPTRLYRVGDVWLVELLPISYRHV